MSSSPATLRALHVHSGNIHGGVERILATLAADRAHTPAVKPEFALCSPGRLRDELCGGGVPVHDLGPVRLSRPWTVWRSRHWLHRLLRTQRPDLVITHSAWGHALFAGVAWRQITPLLFWLHTRAIGNTMLDRLARRHPPNHILSVSADTDATAHRLFSGAPSTVCLTPLGLSPAVFACADIAQTRLELDTPADAVVIIQVSRFERWKGHAIHLEALRQLAADPTWHAWFVGGANRPAEHAYFAELQQTARAAGLEKRVHFLGPRDDVPRLLQAADIFCQPNLASEGFSIAFTEAALAGLPIITSRLGGALELVDDTVGRLVPPGDARSVSSALATFLRDAPLRRRLGEAARARVLQLCDPARQFTQIEMILRETIHGRGARSAACR